MMKDAYSFHPDEEDASSYYRQVYEAYKRVFSRCGLKFKPVEAQSGAIGGSFSHEFMVLAETGEETIVSCSRCDYAANIERAEIKDAGTAAPPSSHSVEDFPTPGAYSVEDVSRITGEPKSRFLKTQIYMADGKPVMALLRGDHELNEAKLAAAVGRPDIARASEEQYVKFMGCPVGFAGPQGHPGLPIYADFAVKSVGGGVTGANKADTHARHVSLSRDYQVRGFFDLRQATAEDPCPRCGSRTEFFKGIEVGHTFKLGTKYSQAMAASYLDKQQKPQVMVMGCYGIGVSRVVAAAIEQGHDADGIVWPLEIAPYHVALVLLDEADDGRIRPAADKLVGELESRGVEVLEDDRDAKPGVKFKDIDLIGIPLRLVLSRKTMDAKIVEFRRRGLKEPERWPLDQQVADKIARMLSPLHTLRTVD